MAHQPSHQSAAPECQLKEATSVPDTVAVIEGARSSLQRYSNGRRHHAPLERRLGSRRCASQQALNCLPQLHIPAKVDVADSCLSKVGPHTMPCDAEFAATPPILASPQPATNTNDKPTHAYDNPLLFVNRAGERENMRRFTTTTTTKPAALGQKRHNFSASSPFSPADVAGLSHFHPAILRAYESLSTESDTFSKILHRRSLARTLSAMYALIMVTISFCFVISMLWIDQFTRMSTDIISTLLLLPGILFIVVSFLTMYEPHDINKLSRANSGSKDETRVNVLRRAWRFLSRHLSFVWRRVTRCRRHRRIFAGSVKSNATMSSSSTNADKRTAFNKTFSHAKTNTCAILRTAAGQGGRADDNEPLNVYLKAATIIFTLGSVTHHLVLLIGFHFTPLMPPPHSLSFSSPSSATSELGALHQYHHQYHPYQLLLPLTTANAAARAAANVPLANNGGLNNKRASPSSISPAVSVVAEGIQTLDTNAKLTVASSPESSSSSANNFNPQDAFSWDEFFWHMYTLLSVLLYLLELAFTLKMSRFRFTKHPLLSCLGMVHLFAINAYLWLYLTALETQVDLGEHQYSSGFLNEEHTDRHHQGSHVSTSSGFDATITTNFGQSLLSSVQQVEPHFNPQDEALQILLNNLLATLHQTQQRYTQNGSVELLPLRNEPIVGSTNSLSNTDYEKLYTLLLQHLEVEQQLRAILNETSSTAALANAVRVISPPEITLPQQRRRKKRSSVIAIATQTASHQLTPATALSPASSLQTEGLEKQDLPLMPESPPLTASGGGGGGAIDGHEYLTKPLGASLKSNGSFIRSLPEYLFHFVIEMVIINMTLFFVKWFQLTRMPQPHRQLRHNNTLSSAAAARHRPVQGPNNSWESSTVYYTSSSNAASGAAAGESAAAARCEKSGMLLFVNNNHHNNCNSSKFRKCEPNLSSSSSAFCINEDDQHVVSNNWRTLVTVLRHESLRGALSLISGAAFVICTIAAVWLLKWDEDDLIFRLLSLTFECVLYIVTIAAGLYAWRKLSSKLHRVKKRSVRERTEKALLGLSIIGIYSFATFLVLGSHREVTLESMLTWLSSLLMIVETSVQTILIYDAIKRAIVQIQLPELGSTTYDGHELRRHRYVQLPKNISTSCLTGGIDGSGGRLQFLMHDIADTCSTNGHKNDDAHQFRRHKCPGRDTLGFLVLANIAFWFINVFRTVKARAHPLQMEYYGPVAWTILVHLTVPFMILFRFHSSCMLFEIWINAHKIFTLVGNNNYVSEAAGSGRDVGPTNCEQNRLIVASASNNSASNVKTHVEAVNATQSELQKNQKWNDTSRAHLKFLIPGDTSFGYCSSASQISPAVDRPVIAAVLPCEATQKVFRQKSALKLLPSDEGIQSFVSDDEQTRDGSDNIETVGNIANIRQNFSSENQCEATAPARLQRDNKLGETRRYASL